MTTEQSSRDIIEDFKPHIHADGLTQPWPHSGSNNGVRYTGDYLLALVKEGRLDEERERLLKVFESVQREPGLLMRAPSNAGGYQSIDDTTAAITASYFLGGDFAKKFLEYGRSKPARSVDQTDGNKKKVKLSAGIFGILKSFGPVQWVYNNVNPETFAISSWMGRFPQLIAHAQFASGEAVPIWRQLWWAGSIIDTHSTQCVKLL